MMISAAMMDESHTGISGQHQQVLWDHGVRFSGTVTSAARNNEADREKMIQTARVGPILHVRRALRLHFHGVCCGS
jgi:hypothetical protein